jgi:hypothetical protein
MIFGEGLRFILIVSVTFFLTVVQFGLVQVFVDKIGLIYYIVDDLILTVELSFFGFEVEGKGTVYRFLEFIVEFGDFDEN